MGAWTAAGWPVARRWPAWAWALAAYVLAWTLLPALLSPSLPLDVVEGIAWGQAWQWGYFKHPPLPAWLLVASFQLLGRFGPYLLGQLAVLLALFYVHRLARVLLGPERAGLAALLLYAVYYYTWPTLEFNHNMAQLPAWAALAWHAHQVTYGAPGRQLRHWLWLGAWAGLGLLAKYSTAVLLLCLAASLLWHDARVLRRPGPWLALAVAGLVLAPHVLWLVRHGGMPFEYFAARAGGGPRPDHASGLEVLAVQLLAHAPLLAIALACGLRPWPWRWRWNLAVAEPAQRRWLLAVALAPALLVAAGGSLLGARLHPMWGTPMWNLSAVLLLAGVAPEGLARRRAALGRALALWMALMTLAMAGYLGWSWQGRAQPTRMDWPAQALGAQAQRQWQQLARCPLRVVAGSIWEAGLVAEGVRPMAAVLVDADPRLSPSITPERLRREGALLVWHVGDYDGAPAAPVLDQAPPGSWRVSQGEWRIPWPRHGGGAPLHIAWRAYVPPACQRP